MGKFIDLTGRRFGCLTVIARTEDYVSPQGRKCAQWTCRCDCGQSTAVLGNGLRSGHTQSCGCLQRKIFSRRSQRRGDLHHTWKGDEIGYQAAHRRVKVLRGSASSQVCVDCGDQAREWSYAGGCSRERVSIAGPWRGIKYSPDPERYVARCPVCHRRFDRTADEAA